MCSRVQCRSCGRPSFSGCGNHVEQVLGDVPATDRCQCGSGRARASAAPAGQSSWLSKFRKG